MAAHTRILAGLLLTLVCLNAISRADARGLMQMQPATATAVARRWHGAPPSHEALFDPDVAIKLGAMYVRELLDRYKGQLDESLAAYNAGPQSVARWLPANPMDADVWIENIPYTETRGYIQHILEHIADPTALLRRARRQASLRDRKEFRNRRRHNRVQRGVLRA